MRLLYLAILLSINSLIIAQGVGISDNEFTPDESAGLEIQYSDKGLLIPRLALTSTLDASTISSPATSLLVFNTGTGGLSPAGFYYNNGTPSAPEWVLLINKDNLGENIWKPDGNAGTVSGTNFIVTTDEQDLDFRTNNIIRARFTTKGQLEILNSGHSVFIGEGAGENDDLYWNKNVFIGDSAGCSNTSGIENIAIGFRALKYNDSGWANTACGTSSLMMNSSGIYNVGIGTASLMYNTTCKYNTALGAGANGLNTIANNNTSIGFFALKNNKTACNNISIGCNSLNNQSFNNNNTIWISNNIAIGDSSMFYNEPTKTDEGINNLAVGHSSLYSNLTGIQNTAIGNGSLKQNDYGNTNTAVGYNSQNENTDGAFVESCYYDFFLGVWNCISNKCENNTSVGGFSMLSNAGSRNTAIGTESLKTNMGNDNISIGTKTMYSNSGSNNIAFGNNALSNNDGEYNLAFGNNALENNNTSKNIAFGHSSMRANTKGSCNIAIGVASLYSQSFNNAGTIFNSYNIAIGDSSLYYNQPTNVNNGVENTAIGHLSMKNNTIGARNVSIGTISLYSNTIGYENTSIGYSSLYSNSNGRRNSAFGCYALNSNISGDSNIGVGHSSLFDLEDGDYNIGIGVSSLNDIVDGARNVAIGTGAGANTDVSIYSSVFVGYNASTVNNLSAYDNSIAIGQTSRIFASRQVRIGNGTSNPATSIGGPVEWTTDSDGRFKDNVQENVPGIEFISKLRPVTYSFNTDKLNDYLQIPDSCRNRAASAKDLEIVRTGFIAQEVEQAAKECDYNFHGVDAPKSEYDYYGLRYAEFVVPLVKATQEQQEIIETQEDKIEQLEQENIEIKQQLISLQEQINNLQEMITE
ncbi:MAG: hypothetical protein C0596_09105 [Marinilabiliales bacterium]|nr:MAG: hypothetical protein C0596_09105 [Marinilabiliales bacterium]